MPKSLEIWPQEEKTVDGAMERSAVVELPTGGSRTLWFRVPEGTPHALFDRADPFAIALIFLAMRAPAPMKVHGAVSPSLLRNLEELEYIWQCWEPATHTVVELEADVESESQPAPETHALACFSGGLDACFTAYRHSQDKCGRQRRDLRACLLVHGFDVALSQTEGFARAAQNAQRILDSVNLPLFTMSTNIREFDQPWLHSFSTACAAAMAWFQPSFRFGLIASNERYDYFKPIGSTPLTDMFLSSDAFTIVHDGASFGRVDKVGLVAEWPEALQYLRVCWEGKDGDRNCGRCEKCVRTILNFRVSGHPKPAAFEHDVAVDDIEALPPLTGPWITEYQLILDRAVANGLGNEPWARAIDRKLRRDRLRLWWPEMRRKVALRTRAKQLLGR